MEVFFLAAGRPIVKTYRLNERGKLEKESYPHLHQFTSRSYRIDAIESFYQLISEYAQAGHCLVKGVLQHPLNNESRAGSTSPDSTTEWVCLDFDGINGFETVDDALTAMGCGDTDYVLQWSASQSMPESGRLNCHIFMLLNEPIHPSLLKRWLKNLNLATDLKKELRLAKSGNALLWPLDITTCQNDKLLYIAPPVFEGMGDPLKGPRIQLVKKQYRKLNLDLADLPPPPLLAKNELKALNRARKAEGYAAKRSYRLDTQMDTAYLVKPDEAHVTGIRTERGFVYFNLNGGDSWGYYHPVDNPTFIYNFKGEPVYRTEDLLPAYWADLRDRVANLEPDSAGRVYLAFRDFESATYWNGIYDGTNKQIIKLAQAKSESQLRHFMVQHGQPLGDFIPDWEMVFEPRASYVVDQKKRRLNIYRPSPHFARAALKQDEVPPTIARVLHHVVGSSDMVYEHFLNWLAVIVQTLSMTQTAWVLHGTQGTGKGVMFNHILTPLFGANNVTTRRMEELGSDFTEFMKNKFIVFIDEVNAGNTLFHERVTAKLKNLIVEPRISVREMYRPSTVIENYSNLIFASNMPRPVSISPDDRRFNVGVFQGKPIGLTSVDITMLETEIGDFYDYLKTRPADTDKARKPIHTEDRARIIDLSRASIDIAIESLRKGKLSFFEDMLVDKVELLSPRIMLLYDQYKDLVHDLRKTRRTKITRDEILILLRWCVDNVPEAPNRFTAMLRHHSLELKPVWTGTSSVRGYDVGEWID